MDIIAGLTAATQAVQLVNELRSIDRSLDEASYKLKLADLMTALADTRIALSDAKETIAARDSEIRQLKQKIDDAQKGDQCPKCKSGHLLFESERPDRIFGDMGVKEVHFVCSNENCLHRTSRRTDQYGRLK